MADIVIVGAGPVGLWTAIQIKKRRPEYDIQMYERYDVYQRSHVLRLDHWSLLLYGCNSKDAKEKFFYEEITGKNLTGIITEAAASLYIRTNDLESALRSYALDSGIKITKATIDSPESVMSNHPECNMFLAADGAHSKMRNQLFGNDSTENYPLQYIVEVKYQVKGTAKKLNPLGDHLKANQQIENMAFEYVGKEKNGITPVSVRFFIDEETYKTIPEASFKNPLSINSPELPLSLQNDILKYMAIRSAKAENENCIIEGKLTKLTLSCYSSKKFTAKKDGKGWFLVGDAAMGVPYFRALNSGMILGSRLGQILCSQNWPINDDLNKKILFYDIHRPMHIATEFSIAKGKNMVLKGYDSLRKITSNIISDDVVDEAYITKYNQAMAFGCENIEEPPKITKKTVK